jgi:hypothetical protein
VWVSASEARRLARFLDLSLEQFRTRYLRRVKNRCSLTERANGDCVFFRGGCTVYPVRPQQCRTFPFWSENLRSEDAWAEAGEGCPGIGRGRLYSPEEIRLIRRGEGAAQADPRSRDEG